MNLIAQIDYAGALFSYGPLGIFCLWFMFREEKRDKKIENLGRSVDFLTRSILLATLQNDAATQAVKQQAQSILDQMPKDLQ